MSKVRIAFTVNWEGRNLRGVEALARLRDRLPTVPVTHFVSAAYFGRGGDLGQVVEAMRPAFRKHDEVGLLVTPWASLHGGLERDVLNVIAGEDPVLDIDYPGVMSQQDCGYTRALSALQRSTINALIGKSKALLGPLLKALAQSPRIPVEALLRGFRAGHGMAADTVLEEALAAGFLYDASALDALWAQRDANGVRASAFGPWIAQIARLWGSEPNAEAALRNEHCLRRTAGFGVDRRTQPFFIIQRDGESRLLELPNNGGMLPPGTFAELLTLLRSTLEQPVAGASHLSFGIHQETAGDGIAEMVERSLAGLVSEPTLEWTTLSETAAHLLGQRVERPVPALQQRVAAGYRTALR